MSASDSTGDPLRGDDPLRDQDEAEGVAPEQAHYALPEEDVIAGQPADPVDLQRHPPRSPNCAAIRALLRDYVDGELELGARTRIEEHAHTCRECALALARGEHEVLRLREALAADAETHRRALASFRRREDDEDAPFTRQVMQRIERDAASPRRPPSDFTAGVMARVRREEPRRSSLRERFFLPAKRGWVPLVLALAVLAYMLLRDAMPAETVVQLGESARATVVGAGGIPVRPAPAGTVLGEGTWLGTEAGGNASLRRVRRDEVLDEWWVGGGSRLAVESGGLLLVLGAFEVRAAVPVQARLAALASAVEEDAAQPIRVALEAGRYRLVSEAVRRADAALGPRNVVRHRLEVIEGGAEVQRGAQDVAVAAGEVAHFDGWSQVVVEPTAEALLAASRDVAVGVDATDRRALPAEPGERGSVAGSVLTRDGRPAAHASVVAWTSHGQLVTRADAEGRFALPGAESLAGTFAVLQVLPAEGSTDASGARLGAFGPRVVRIDPRGAGSATLPEIRLAAGVERRGRVLDAEGRSLAGARITPCLVDEVFGDVVPETRLARQSDAQGAFVVDGLAVDLAPGLACWLLVEHAGAGRAALLRVGAENEGSADCTLRMPARRDLLLRGFAAGARLEVFESVVGLPPGALERRSEVVAGGDGAARVGGIGAGPVRVREAGRGTWLSFTESAANGDRVLQRNERARFRGLAGESLAARSGFTAERGRADGLLRHRALSGVRENPNLFVSVRDATSGIARSDVLVLLLRRGAATPELLGEFDGLRSLAAATEAGAEVVLLGLASDGAVGAVRETVRADRPFCTLDLRGPRPLRVARAAGWREDEPVLVRALDGELRGMAFWRVPALAGEGATLDLGGIAPGRYEVRSVDGRIQTVTVTGG